jgi:hypothetical protein
VCIDTACALAEADVGKGWREGWRSQRGLTGDREWYVSGGSTAGDSNCQQCKTERAGRRGIEQLKAGGVGRRSLACLKDCCLIRCRSESGNRNWEECLVLASVGLINRAK